jgi:hypothetical protein
MNEPVVPGGSRKQEDWLGPPFANTTSVIWSPWGWSPGAWTVPASPRGSCPRRSPPNFIAVHLYPEKGKLAEAIETLKGFSVGRPVVVEEMFPLRCSAAELGSFINQSRKVASGWIGFYWGKTPEEYRRSGTIQDAIVLSWLELFQRHGPPASRPAFILGADISWVQQREDEGVRFSDHGKQKDILAILKVPNVRQINDIVRSLPSSKGLGTFIWEPTKWEGPALFDSTGNTKPEIEVYPRMAEDYRKGER